MYKKGFFSSIADAIQFANEENVKIISLLPIHYDANGYADKYALVYQEQTLEGFFPLFYKLLYIFLKKVYNKNIIKVKEYQLNFNWCRNKH